MSGTEKHTLHGRIVTKFERASPELVKRFDKHDTAKLVDSMGGHGAMHYEIKPLENNMRVLGTALTVLTRPGDALYVQKAIDETKPGDVVIISARRLQGRLRDRRAARLLLQAQGCGRHHRRRSDPRRRSAWSRTSPPTFARSTCLRIFGSTGPGAINVPVSCGGVTVNPGDIIMGDRDGVVVVPREDAERIADLADAHLEGELARMKDVEAGKSVTDAFGLAPKLARWEA